jgi:predicted TIM-barrel fold metal-dependent hydrolase
MITGFNSTDMYAADHIRRVLVTFPGVLSGMGEFTIHKEFVSAKIAGETASLTNPAIDRIVDFAAEVGFVVLIHNDVDVPFPQDGSPPAYLGQMEALLKRHPNVPIIWAHCGVGRIVRPVKQHSVMLESILSDTTMCNVYFDISWDEVAKYIVTSPESVRITADLINRYPERFLFGTDEVAPSKQEKYLRVYYLYEPLWEMLSVEASKKVREGNYECLFDEARHKVRAWEKAHGRMN